MPREGLHQFLAKLFSERKADGLRFVIDVSFIEDEDAFPLLDDSFFDELTSHGSSLVLPRSCFIDLGGDSNRVSDHLNRVGCLIRKGCLRAVDFGKTSIPSIFTRFRKKFALVLFTQDKGIAVDVLSHASEAENPIFVAHYVQGEGIVIFDQPAIPLLPSPAGHTEVPPPFSIKTVPRSLESEVIGSGHEFSKGSHVYTADGTPISLRLLIAGGGEGEIYETDDESVAKIYHHDRRTVARRDKLQLMCSRGINIPNVAWPKEVLFDHGGDFVGFLMPRVRGTPLQHCAFGKKTLLECFPSWKRRNLVELAATYAHTVDLIHRQGLLIGDINPMNILVVSSWEIWIVDVDSFQVDDFPCPVGMANFRAPEINEPNYALFLRNQEHELFALSCLIFMILMGGKAPYSHQGGGDPSENIRAGNFPYGVTSGAIPPGAYRYIWSYFPKYLQETFIRTFASPSSLDRPTASQWVAMLNRYSKEILHSSQDATANVLWPSSFKPWDLESSVELTCATCGVTFLTSQRDAARRKRYPVIRCGNCVSVRALAKKAKEGYNIVSAPEKTKPTPTHQSQTYPQQRQPIVFTRASPQTKHRQPRLIRMLNWIGNLLK